MPDTFSVVISEATCKPLTCLLQATNEKNILSPVAYWTDTSNNFKVISVSFPIGGALEPSLCKLNGFRDIQRGM